MRDPLRHHRDVPTAPHAYGTGRFARFAENLADGMGTPGYIVAQTTFLVVWIAANVVWLTAGAHWDPYPFILLNLLLSTQAAYASPFVTLANKVQSARDILKMRADALHAEELAARHRELIEANTELTRQVHQLTSELHEHLL